MNRQCIIVSGDVIAGHTLTGPFDTFKAARYHLGQHPQLSPAFITHDKPELTHLCNTLVNQY